MNHFLIFGTHPMLSLAEAKTIIPGTAPTLIQTIALFERESWDGEVLQNRLGGTVKLGDVLTNVPAKELTGEHLADIIDALPRADKVIFSISLFGDAKDIKPFHHLPIQLKRTLQERGQKVRWFAGEEGEVSPAAVTKLHLTDEGYDFCIAFQNGTAFVGVTTHVQNADAWSLRDFGRPFRDATTGMLPPKLARMMVNLAGTFVGRAGTRPAPTILDPFCGGGTVLMEAALCGYEHIVGSDVDKTQIDGARKNMKWLENMAVLSSEVCSRIKLIQSPVENISEHMDEPITAIITEGYLGKPLQGNETAPWLEQQKTELETLWKRTFESFTKVQPAGGRVVCVWPIFKTKNSTIAVDATHAAELSGYHLVNSFDGWAPNDGMGVAGDGVRHTPLHIIYARPGQHVQRRIAVMEKR